jgi:hypothetical protein
VRQRLCVGPDLCGCDRVKVSEYFGKTGVLLSITLLNYVRVTMDQGLQYCSVIFWFSMTMYPRHRTIFSKRPSFLMHTKRSRIQKLSLF